MTAQSRGTRQPDDTYQFKMNTVDSMDIPAPTRTSFLPDGGAGVYGVGSVGNNNWKTLRLLLLNWQSN